MARPKHAPGLDLRSSTIDRRAVLLPGSDGFAVSVLRIFTWRGLGDATEVAAGLGASGALDRLMGGLLATWATPPVS